MATIDMGSAAINRADDSTTATRVDKNNPANASGKITQVQLYANVTMTNVEVATFYVVSGNNLSTRDTQAIANVVAGATRTFDVDLDVQVGDYLGVYYSAGELDRDNSGDGQWKLLGDYIPCTDTTFDFIADRTFSIYGTGVYVKVIAGEFTAIGSISSIKTAFQSLAGTLTLTGNILRKISKSLVGILTSTGILSSVKGYKKALSGVLSFTSSLTVWIHYTWVGVTKAISDWNKVSKVTDDCTKVSKEKGEWERVERKR